MPTRINTAPALPTTPSTEADQTRRTAPAEESVESPVAPRPPQSRPLLSPAVVDGGALCTPRGAASGSKCNSLGGSAWQTPRRHLKRNSLRPATNLPGLDPSGEEGGEDKEAMREAKELQEARSRQLGYNPQRTPAWCDRILWRSYPHCSCELLEYCSETRVDTSDHTPVSATFVVGVALPGEYEKGAGDRHEWELSVQSVEMEIPLASLDPEDIAAAQVRTAAVARRARGLGVTAVTRPLHDRHVE